MDLWKLCFIFIGIFHNTQAASLRCYDGTLDNAQVFSLDQPQQLFNSTCINLANPTVFYTFGYRGKVAGPATTTVLSAYLATKKTNVVLLDWEDEASNGTLGVPLSYALSAVPNAKRIGSDLGDALVKLAGYGMSSTQMHLMGHSLGAHLMAYAGRRSREKGLVVSRITGLDPARPLFEGVISNIGLDRTAAKFVDIIHTSPGDYGISKPKGTVDLWPNYAGDKGKQPGCPIGDFPMFSTEDLCSHDRSWRYFSEAIGSPTNFPASYAENYDSWVANDGQSDRTTYLGDVTNTSAEGNFFLVTASTSPYGLKEQGLIPDDN